MNKAELTPEESDGAARADAVDVHDAVVRSLPPHVPAGGRRRGPRTATGKARVSANAIRHGMTSTRLVVPGECAVDIEAFRAEIVQALAPVGPVETELAERVAVMFQRLRRVRTYEEATIAERQHHDRPSARLMAHPDDLDKIIRYEATMNRQLYQALHELEARQAARHGQATPLGRDAWRHGSGHGRRPGGGLDGGEAIGRTGRAGAAHPRADRR